MCCGGKNVRGVAPLDAMDRKSVARSQPSQSGSASQRPQISDESTQIKLKKLVTISLGQLHLWLSYSVRANLAVHFVPPGLDTFVDVTPPDDVFEASSFRVKTECDLAALRLCSRSWQSISSCHETVEAFPSPLL